MDANVLIAIIGGVGTVAGATLGFLGTRKGSLAQAEQNFRDTIVKENEKLRNRVDELEDELLAANRRILKMEALMIKAGLVIEDEEESP